MKRLAALVLLAACHHAETHAIAIRGMKFVPDHLVVKSGDTVVWTNEDLVPHTATGDALFDSGSIDADGSFSYTTRQTGELSYHCSFHPVMKATLTSR